jgi:ligand-binding sensor domain-containing protein
MNRFSWLFSGCLLLTLLVGGATAPGPSRAQAGDGVWKDHTLEFWTNALVVRDSTLWVGTAGGLIRWNLSEDTTIKYTPADGLVGMQIYDLALDGQGNIWVGHERGLSVFDGSTWITYDKYNSGVPSDEVIQVEVAGDGTVWLISQPIASDIGLGVTVFNGTTWHTYEEANSDLPDDNAISIALDQDDHLWVGARDGDVAEFDGAGWTVYPDPTYNHNSMNVVGPDTLGQMWFTSLYNYAPVLMFDGAVWHHIIPENGCDNGVRYGAFDGNGELWLSTWAGLCRYNGTTWSRYHSGNSGILNDMVKAVTAQGQKVWLGYMDGASVEPVTVTQFDGASWVHYHKPQFLPSGFGLGLAADDEGRKWFGLGNKGVAVLDGETWMVYDDSNSGLPATCTTRITVDNTGHMWFAGRLCAGGLVEFDGVSWIQHYGTGGVPDTMVRAVAVDQNNFVWAGSGQGLSVFNRTSWTTYNTTNSCLPNDTISTVVIDGAGYKWVGCTTRFDGANCLQYGTVEEAIQAHYDDIVDTYDGDFRCWVADPARGKVWKGESIQGVKAYNGASWQLVGYTEMDLAHLYSWVAWPQGLDRAGNLWVVAGDGIPRYGGVSRFDGTTWTGYRQADGLLEAPKFEMAADEDNHVWFTSGFGVSEFFDPSQPTHVTVTPASGGSLVSADGSTMVTFPAGAVTQDMVVTYTPMQPSATGSLVGIGHFFDLSATAGKGISLPDVDFEKPYTLTVDYTHGELGTAIENTLGVYWWDGGQWLPEPTSRVEAGVDRVTANPDHMTLFAVLGETNRLYLPLVMRSGS